MPGCDCTLSYFKSLVDPFETGGVKMGWGCMVPTAVPQGYFRGSFDAGTDGSLTVAVLPCATVPILVWNTSASTVATTSSNDLGNTAAIVANCGEGRVVSVGVRAFPNIALTSIPGSAYSGATVATSFANVNSLATNDFVQLPTSHQSIGVQGISSTGRPVDPDSFTFFTAVVDGSGYASTLHQNETLPFSVPYVTFLGLPASASVFVEVVINFEATQTVAHAGSTVLGDNALQGETVGDHWPTPEGLHRLIGPYLPHPGRPGEAAAAGDSRYLDAMWSGIKGLAGSVAKALAPAASAALRTASMSLMGGGGVSGQRYGRQYAGYLM